MKHEKIVKGVIALELAALLCIGVIDYFGSISNFCQFVCWEVERVPRIGLIERDMTRSDMLLRFGSPADYMKIYYDMSYKTDVTKFYYRIDEDDSLFLEFTSSWQTDKIIGFSLVRGYRDWHFCDYGSSLYEY